MVYLILTLWVFNMILRMRESQNNLVKFLFNSLYFIHSPLFLKYKGLLYWSLSVITYTCLICNSLYCFYIVHYRISFICGTETYALIFYIVFYTISLHCCFISHDLIIRIICFSITWFYFKYWNYLHYLILSSILI